MIMFWAPSTSLIVILNCYCFYYKFIQEDVKANGKLHDKNHLIIFSTNYYLYILYIYICW